MFEEEEDEEDEDGHDDNEHEEGDDGVCAAMLDEYRIAMVTAAMTRFRAEGW